MILYVRIWNPRVCRGQETENHSQSQIACNSLCFLFYVAKVLLSHFIGREAHRSTHSRRGDRQSLKCIAAHPIPLYLFCLFARLCLCVLFTEAFGKLSSVVRGPSSGGRPVGGHRQVRGCRSGSASAARCFLHAENVARKGKRPWITS